MSSTAAENSPLPTAKQMNAKHAGKGRKNVTDNEAPLGGRLPATPGTSGRPRASPTKTLDSSPKKALAEEQLPTRSISSRIEELWTAGLQQAAQAKTRFAVGKDAVRARSLEIRERAKGKLTELRSQSRELQDKAHVKAADLRAKTKEKLTELQSHARELQEKAQVKAADLREKTKELGGHFQARAAARSSEARTLARELTAGAQAVLRDLLEEVQQLGFWKHPAPLALGCFVALLFFFLHCSLTSSWPVALPTPPPHQHHRAAVFEQQGITGGAPAAATGNTEEEELPSTGGATSTSQSGAPTPLIYEQNSQLYLAARKALKAGQFEEGYRALVELSNQGALSAERPAENFGNFSRAGFLTDLGASLVFTGQYLEAVPLLAAGLRGGAASGFALNALGIAYRSLGDVKSALGAFETAAHHFAPRNPKAWSNLGVVAMELGKLQKADDAFYYATEAYGAGVAAALDETLVNNVRILQNRALGKRAAPGEEEVALLEVWYDSDVAEAEALEGAEGA